jgi:5'-3' exonuclease
MQVHLLDGTYELFRHHFAVPSHIMADGREVAATRGVLGSVLMMLEGGVTHVGVATDHVIESFRNNLWPGYKSSAGIEPALLQQFPLLEDALAAMGVVVWPMVELEADDALAAAALAAAADPEVERVFICTPDKDLGQSVRGDRVVQFDRRKRMMFNEEAIIDKFGVSPESIPDYLALVGDSSDGFPGLPGWGPRSAATVLSRYRHLEAVPPDVQSWDLNDAAALRGAVRLSATLEQKRDLAYLFRDLATLRTDTPLFETVEELRWQGPTEAFEDFAERLEAPELCQRAQAASRSRGSGVTG